MSESPPDERPRVASYIVRRDDTGEEFEWPADGTAITGLEPGVKYVIGPRIRLA